METNDICLQAHLPYQKELIEMCLHNISFDLSLHLTPQTFLGFDDLISKAYNLENRLLEHNQERKGKTVVNKLEFAMIGAKKPGTKLLVKKTVETTTVPPSRQEASTRRLNMKERQDRTYTFHPDDLESFFKQTLKFGEIVIPESKRLAKVDKVNDPKYYRYYCMLGHTL